MENRFGIKLENVSINRYTEGKCIDISVEDTDGSDLEFQLSQKLTENLYKALHIFLDHFKEIQE